MIANIGNELEGSNRNLETISLCMTCKKINLGTRENPEWIGEEDPRYKTEHDSHYKALKISHGYCEPCFDDYEKENLSQL